MRSQDLVLIAFPPYGVAAAVGIMVIQLIVFQIDVQVGVVIDLDELIGVRAVHVRSIRDHFADDQCRRQGSIYAVILHWDVAGRIGSGVDAIRDVDHIRYGVHFADIAVRNGALEHAILIAHGDGAQSFFALHERDACAEHPFQVRLAHRDLIIRERGEGRRGIDRQKRIFDDSGCRIVPWYLQFIQLARGRRAIIIDTALRGLIAVRDAFILVDRTAIAVSGRIADSAQRQPAV